MVPSIAAVVLILLTLSLGRWQLNRAEEKSTLQSLFESRIGEAPLLLNSLEGNGDAIQYRQVIARGEFLGEKQIYLDNKILAERVGYHVITPLRMQNETTSVLVNRGWIPRGKEYPVPPWAPVPIGFVEVSGIAVLPAKRFLELSAVNTEGRVWQNITFARVREKLGLEVIPIILLAKNTTPNLIAVHELPDVGIESTVAMRFNGLR